MHLLEMAWALGFEAGSPVKYWGECVMTAAYLINRLPSSVDDKKIPYEVIHN